MFEQAPFTICSVNTALVLCCIQAHSCFLFWLYLQRNRHSHNKDYLSPFLESLAASQVPPSQQLSLRPVLSLLQRSLPRRNDSSPESIGARGEAGDMPSCYEHGWQPGDWRACAQRFQHWISFSFPLNSLLFSLPRTSNTSSAGTATVHPIGMLMASLYKAGNILGTLIPSKKHS